MSAGVVSDTYTYDAFGVLLTSNGTTTNVYLYTGEQLDANVGFYYLRARYYAQAQGRFMTTDPEDGNIFDPVSLHRYLYANADPVDNRDPLGRLTLAEALIVSVIVGILAGIGVYFATGSKTAALIVGITVAAGVFVLLIGVVGVTVSAGAVSNLFLTHIVRLVTGRAAREGVKTALKRYGRVILCALLVAVKCLVGVAEKTPYLVPGWQPGRDEAIRGALKTLKSILEELLKGKYCPKVKLKGPLESTCGI
jgi:RHS repeat-associated protein